jgi:hypothetical protein
MLRVNQHVGTLWNTLEERLFNIVVVSPHGSNAENPSLVAAQNGKDHLKIGSRSFCIETRDGGQGAYGRKDGSIVATA